MQSGRTGDRGVDALVVAALPEEFEAARSAGLTDDPEGPGVVQWEERDSEGSPFLWGEYRVSRNRRFTVGLARPLQMGGRSTGTLVAGLAGRLNPGCLAMCGVCAGDPDSTALGDVVVGDPVYEWDEGKRSVWGFEGDHRQVPLDPRWARAAQDFDPAGLASYGEASEDEARLWLLEQLHRGQEPRNHPALRCYFSSGAWQPGLARLEDDGLVHRERAGGVTLTPRGTALVQRRLFDDVDGPQRLPFRVLAAPMASGSAVIADPEVWVQLRKMGMRKIAAAEMEAATVATVAHERRLPWLVAKGVMDYGDTRKDDRYKQFAARASAEVMFALLGRLLATVDTPASTGRPAFVDLPPPRRVLLRAPTNAAPPPATADTATKDRQRAESPATAATETATILERRWRITAVILAVTVPVLLVFIPTYRDAVPTAGDLGGGPSPLSTSSQSAMVAASPSRPVTTPTAHRSVTSSQRRPTGGGSPGNPDRSFSNRGSNAPMPPPTQEATRNGGSHTCPDRHVPVADKVFQDGGDAFTVADFHPISEPTDPAASHPRLRIDGDNLLGEYGAKLRLLRDVPEGDRLNCDTGGTGYAKQLSLVSIKVGDVVVARTSLYVGKLEITGTGDGMLTARTTSYFVEGS